MSQVYKINIRLLRSNSSSSIWRSSSVWQLSYLLRTQKKKKAGEADSSHHSSTSPFTPGRHSVDKG